jgi:hypothetical protein
MFITATGHTNVASVSVTLPRVLVPAAVRAILHKWICLAPMSELEIVARVFPDRQLDIHRLAQRSESFRDLCAAPETQQYRDLLHALVAEAGHFLKGAVASAPMGLPTRA